MPITEQFIALSVRNIRVINAMTQAIEAMQAIDLSSEVGAGEYGRCNLAREIAGLKEALYLMGDDLRR